MASLASLLDFLIPNAGAPEMDNTKPDTLASIQSILGLSGSPLESDNSDTTGSGLGEFLTSPTPEKDTSGGAGTMSKALNGGDLMGSVARKLSAPPSKMEKVGNILAAIGQMGAGLTGGRNTQGYMAQESQLQGQIDKSRERQEQRLKELATLAAHQASVNMMNNWHQGSLGIQNQKVANYVGQSLKRDVTKLLATKSYTDNLKAKGITTHKTMQQAAEQDVMATGGQGLENVGQAPQAGGRVTIYKDGQPVGTIPQEQVEEAKAQGYTI